VVIKIILFVALTMCAFAANSVLNRIGVARLGMDPMDFAAIRVAAGAVTLCALVWWRGGPWPVIWSTRRMAGAAALTVYMIGFSFAYLTLDAGLGALILFGVLQVVIFGFAVTKGEAIPALRWLGAITAFAGLVALLWPAGVHHVPLGGALSMAAAGIAWAIYTLLGRAEPDATGASAVNFALCLPLVALALPFSAAGGLSGAGIGTAIIAGAVTSGLGYALWYRILPALPATMAGIAQLSVPVLTVLAGVALLGEPVTFRFIIAGALVLGGIGLSLITKRG
jgi:drug/metabolite transporter (DMT)-like permease